MSHRLLRTPFHWVPTVITRPTSTMQIRRDGSLFFIVLIVCFIIVLFYQFRSTSNRPIRTTEYRSSMRTMEKFRSSINQYSTISFQKYCFLMQDSEQFAVENLPRYLNNARSSANEICRELTEKFNSLFRLEEIYGALKISPTYMTKINRWLHDDESLIAQIKKQRVIKIYNRYTHEEMLYNYMRSQRPQTKSEQSPENYTSQLMEESKKTCDFCGQNYLSSTAEDSFGRLENNLAYTAANTFKYDRWHTLIVSRNHDTLHLTENEIGQMFELAKEWFEKVYSIESMYTCPEMIWDAMPKSGASQIHTHLQVSLGFDIYYGNIERTRQGARAYAMNNQRRNYFNDYLFVHQALGLTIPIGDVHVIVHLTPIKDLEVMILGEALGNDYYQALHLIFRTFVDDLKEYSFSFGMYLPPMNESSSDGHEIPVVCRLVFRNPVTNLRADMNGLDLYTSSVVGKDRYVLYRQLKDGITKRQK